MRWQKNSKARVMDWEGANERTRLGGAGEEDGEGTLGWEG